MIQNELAHMCLSETTPSITLAFPPGRNYHVLDEHFARDAFCNTEKFKEFSGRTIVLRKQKLSAGYIRNRTDTLKKPDENIVRCLQRPG